MQLDEEDIGSSYLIQPAGYLNPIQVEFTGFDVDEEGVEDEELLLFIDEEDKIHGCYQEDVSPLNVIE
jgi:hypothetical protein